MTHPQQTLSDTAISPPATAFNPLIAIISLCLILSLAATITLWHKAKTESAQRISEILTHRSRYVSNDIQLVLNERAQSLNRIASRWIRHGGIHRDEWEADAERYLKDLVSLDTLAVLDENGKIKWRVSQQTTLFSAGYELAQGNAPERLELQRAQTAFNGSSENPGHLSFNERGIYWLQPLQVPGKATEYLFGYLNSASLFAHIAQEAREQGFIFSLRHQGNRVFANIPLATEQTTAVSTLSSITLGDETLQLEVGITPQALQNLHSTKPFFTLTAGLLIVCFTGFIFWLLLKNIQQEKLRAKDEARWYLAIDSSGQGVWDCNIKTGETFFSDGWKRMLGYQPHDIENHFTECENLLHPDDRAPCLAQLQDYLAGLSPDYHSEMRLRCKDGSYLWMVSRGMVIQRDSSGNPLRITGTLTDIDDQKRHDLQLEAEKSKLSQIIDSQSLATFTIDRKSVV